MTLLRARRFQSHRIDDEVVLFDTETRVAHTLNDTAGYIWELCDGTRSEDEVAEAIARRYDVPPDTARADVSKTITTLLERELLEPETP